MSVTPSSVLIFSYMTVSLHNSLHVQVHGKQIWNASRLHCGIWYTHAPDLDPNIWSVCHAVAPKSYWQRARHHVSPAHWYRALHSYPVYGDCSNCGNQTSKCSAQIRPPRQTRSHDPSLRVLAGASALSFRLSGILCVRRRARVLLWPIARKHAKHWYRTFLEHLCSWQLCQHGIGDYTQ